jgi:hypothetical protein
LVASAIALAGAAGGCFVFWRSLLFVAIRCR